MSASAGFIFTETVTDTSFGVEKLNEDKLTNIKLQTAMVIRKPIVICFLSLVLRRRASSSLFSSTLFYTVRFEHQESFLQNIFFAEKYATA